MINLIEIPSFANSIFSVNALPKTALEMILDNIKKVNETIIAFNNLENATNNFTQNETTTRANYEDNLTELNLQFKSDMSSLINNLIEYAEETGITNAVTSKFASWALDGTWKGMIDNYILSDLTNKVVGASSGSPAGVFASVELLASDVSANSVDGKKRIYVVSSDGHWYYWNGTAWTDSGFLYQSAKEQVNIFKDYVTEIISTTNVVLNPSFEVAGGSGKLLDKWGVTPQSETNGSVERVTDKVVSGTYAVKLTRGTDLSWSKNHLEQLNIPVSADCDYIIEFWCAGDGVNNLTCSIHSPETSSYIFYIKNTGVKNTTYTKFRYKFHTPVGCNKINLFINTALVEGAVGYIDDVEIHKVETNNRNGLPTYVSDVLSYLVGVSNNWKERAVDLILPTAYQLVVGDVFELFYKGIIKAKNPYTFHWLLTCQKGKAYSKKYVFTPDTSDIGNHNLTITVQDDYGTILATKTVNLVVKAKTTSPLSDKNIVCIGDSLTAGGAWVAECYRRFTGTGGTPEGNVLTNINFVGSKNLYGAGYEGIGGWTFNSYNTNTTSENPFYVNSQLLNFSGWATARGITAPDYAYILLGWNNAATSEETYKAQARVFLNAFNSAFPNCKIVFVTLQIPSIDGLGDNYGATNVYNYKNLLDYVFNHHKWCSDLATEFSGGVVSLSGQFDTENNMPEGIRVVNVRNTRTETYGINGVHPDIEGYMQIADGVYRDLNNRL